MEVRKHTLAHQAREHITTQAHTHEGTRAHERTKYEST